MWRKIRSLWVVALFCLTIFYAVDVSFDLVEDVSAGNTLYVNMTGSGGVYTKIQDAINNSNPGDTVFVYSGVYYENLNMGGDLNLIGEKKETTIVDGYYNRDTVKITGNYVNLTGFTIRNSGKFYAGLRIYSNQNIISNNNISSNQWYGIRLQSASNNTISGNNIHSNDRTGLYLFSSSSDNVITGNYIHSNYDSGIGLSSSPNNIISSNNISYNDNGIFLISSKNITIDDNSLYNNVIKFYGSNLIHWNSHSIDNNLLNNKPIHYFKNENSLITPNDASQIILANCSNSLIQNFSVTNEIGQITLGFSNLTTISSNNLETNHRLSIYQYYSSNNNIVSNNNVSIFLDSSSNNYIFSNFNSTIELDNSDNNNISNNKLNGVDDKIHIQGSSNTIFNNSIINGIVELWPLSKYNNITQNNISDSQGLLLYNSDLNNITHNTIERNTNDGIRLWDRCQGNLISYNIISSNYGCGIKTWHSISYSNKFNNNIISNNSESGIYLRSNKFIEIQNNTFIEDGIAIEGGGIEAWNTHSIQNNIINGKQIYYYKNATDIIVPNDAGEVIFGNCSNVVIDNIDILNGDVGIEIGFSSNITIINSNITHNDWHGIYVYYSSKINISNNNINFNNYDGIHLEGSPKTDFYNNNVSSNGNGIAIYDSNNHTISDNDIHFNQLGIYLEVTTDINISNNNIFQNIDGVYLYNSDINNNISNNKIYSNNNGVWLKYSDINHISNNNISFNNEMGLSLDYSTDLMIDNNSFIEDGVVIDGSIISYWNSHIIENNYISGKYIYYYKNMNNIIVPTDASEVILVNCTNFTIQGIDLVQGDIGIIMGYSNNNLISGCNLSNNDIDGIYLFDSSYNAITNNRIISNMWEGIYADKSYYLDINENFISQNNFSIFLYYSFYCDILMNNISGNNYGIFLYRSDYINISKNIISSNDYGLYIDWSTNNNISRNLIINNIRYGMYLYWRSNYNNITYNSICNNIQYGIYLYLSFENNIMSNNLSFNGYGIYLYYRSEKNIITYNNFCYNTEYGSYINNSNNNKIYHNNFTFNTYQSFDNAYNLWNATYPSGGNFWSDYNYPDLLNGPNQNLNGSDGFGDLPYIIDLNAQDNYPLMEPVPDIISPRIYLISPENLSVIQPNITLDFEVFDGYLNSTYISINNNSEEIFLAPYNISTSEWIDGIYELLIKANDRNNNSNSKIFIFTIDSKKPFVELKSEINNTYVQNGTVLDFSIFDLNLLSVNFSINGGINNSLLSPYNISTSGWQDGNYTIQINALDKAGNLNSLLFSFVIDSTNPKILLNSPWNDSIIRNGVILKFSIEDINLLEVNYSVNGAITVPFMYPYDIPTNDWTDGLYTIHVNTIDLAGNTNSTSYSFTIDSTKPIIILNSPPNNSKIKSGEILDFSCLEQNLMEIEYSINNETFVSISEPFNISTIEWQDGNYLIQINTRDHAENSNSSWFYFIIDSTPPEIGFDSSMNHSTIVAGEIIQLEIEALDLDSVFFSLDDGEYVKLPSPYNLDTSDWEDGSHTVSIRATDTLGNEIIHWFEITIDALLPYIISARFYSGFNAEDQNLQITINFSEPMNKTNVEDHITFTPFTGYIYQWDQEGKTLTISFEQNNLTRGTSYTFKLDRQISDLSGNLMESDFEFTFNSESLGPPQFSKPTESSFPYWILALIAIIAAVLLVLFLILGKRKKDNKQIEDYPQGSAQVGVKDQEVHKPLHSDYKEKEENSLTEDEKPT